MLLKKVNSNNSRLVNSPTIKMCAMSQKRPLSPEAQAAARRLRLIWEAKKDSLELTQEQASIECGWTTQGTFSQYLLGKMPLGLEALLKISGVLQVGPEEIYPELAALLPTLMLPESRLTPRERALLSMFKLLTEDQKKRVFRDIQETQQHNEEIFKALSQIRSEEKAS